MIPNTKISQTILEFGKELILDLPDGHSKAELEGVMKIIITVWNAVVMDGWDQKTNYEAQLMNSLNAMPHELRVAINRLIKRKKTKFGNDPRAVGNYWVREQGDKLIFGCEARMNVGDVPTAGAVQ